MPGPATKGSKLPVVAFSPAVAGTDVQVPPLVLAVKFIAASVSHNGSGSQKLASQQTNEYCAQALMLMDSVRPFLLEAELSLCAPIAKTSPFELTLTS